MKRLCRANHRPTPFPSGLRGERDKLLQENDDLRAKCEQMIGQIAEISSNLVCGCRGLKLTPRRTSPRSEMRQKPDSCARPPATSVLGVVKAQPAISKPFEPICVSSRSRLQADSRAKAEDDLMHTQAELEKQLGVANELTKQVCASHPFACFD